VVSQAHLQAGTVAPKIDEQATAARQALELLV
jgi:hypothetical protein